MPRKGLLIEYEYCSGCHSCEVACKQEHNYPADKGGIRLNEIVTVLPNGRVRTDYLPFPTTYCDLCSARTANGQLPSCIKHCQASTMYYGTVAELSKLMDNKPRSVLFTPR